MYGESCITNPIPPPFRRRIWFYNKADAHAIHKSIQIFNWSEHTGNLACLNQQVEILTEALLNIFLASYLIKESQLESKILF